MTRPTHRPVDWELLALDAGLLVAVPLALGVIQLGGSPALHELLTFNSERATLLGWIGHWAVHYSTGLLWANLVGYGLVTGVGYVIAWAQAERRWFRLSVGTILLTVPALSALASDLAFARLMPGLTYTARGASAVVAALLGLLFVVFCGQLERRSDLRGVIAGGGGLLVAVLSGLLVRVGSPGWPTVGALFGAAALIVLTDLVLRLRQRDADDRLRSEQAGQTVLAGTVVLAITLAFTVALFPADPFGGSRITNVYGHAAGFMAGVLIAAWGRRYWSPRSWW